MADYTRQHDFSVKDALTTGDPDKVIKGSEVDEELDAALTAIGTKTNKTTGHTQNNLASLDSVGDIEDSGVLKTDVAKISVITTSLVPAGAVMPFAMETAPSGWLECNGAAVSRTTYATLFAAISTVFGVGNGSTTFNLPDLRGEFIRGWDHGAGTDPGAANRTDAGDGSTTGDNVGTKQGDAIKKHIHKMNYQTKFPATAASGAVAGSATETQTSTTYNTTGPFDVGSSTYVGKNETRSRNVNMMYCIKS